MLNLTEKENMDLRNELNTELKKAMRERDQLAVSTIRLIMAAIKEKDIQLRTQGANEQATDQDILSLLQSMIKQREESVRTYMEGAREDLAAREEDEIRIIKRFLPEQLGEEDLDKAVSDIITETGAKDIKDMGKVMAELKSRYSGQIDMGRASKLVKEKLAA